MTLELRADVFMAEADGMLVFLDLARDRYCALSRADCARLKDLSQAARRKPDEPLVDRLRTAGLLADAGEGRPFAATPGRAPQRGVLPAERLSPIAAVRGALCRAAARRMLKTRHIRDVVERRRAWRRTARPPTDEAHLIALSAQFAAGRPLAGGRNACLSEALGFTFFLGPAGAAADWVFGVKALPFAAHCWVQAGDVVLNDAAENVRNYTPIMVV